MVLARGQQGLTHEANCSSNQSWHDICMGKTGMGFAWVDKCVNLCWSLWSYLYITRVRDYTIRLVLSIVQTCEIFTVDKGHQMRPNEVNSNQDGVTQHDKETSKLRHSIPAREHQGLQYTIEKVFPVLA